MERTSESPTLIKEKALVLLGREWYYFVDEYYQGNDVGMLMKVVKITKKGQATIPKRSREKFNLKDKVLMIETKEGILLKPPPSVDEEWGSLKALFTGKTSRELVEEARKADLDREKQLEARHG